MCMHYRYMQLCVCLCLFVLVYTIFIIVHGSAAQKVKVNNLGKRTQNNTGQEKGDHC